MGGSELYNGASRSSVVDIGYAIENRDVRISLLGGKHAPARETPTSQLRCSSE